MLTRYSWSPPVLNIIIITVAVEVHGLVPGLGPGALYLLPGPSVHAPAEVPAVIEVALPGRVRTVLVAHGNVIGCQGILQFAALGGRVLPEALGIDAW